MKNKIKCPHCKSLEVVRQGIFQTKPYEKQQRSFCKSCSKRFIEQTLFCRMKNIPQKSTLCLDLSYKKVSTRQVKHPYLYLKNNLI
jgi:transposase-like protein